MAARSRRTLWDELRMFRRFVGGLDDFLQRPLPLEHCAGLLRTSRENREGSFLALLRDGIYRHPDSPYRKLLAWAGVDFQDLAGLLRKDGLEETLGRLFEAGVHIHIDEFKGRKPIRRGNLELPVAASDFDNPMAVGHFPGRTGGSRSPGKRLIVDLALVAHDAAAHGIFLEAFDLVNAPLSLWRPVAPGAAGTKKILMHSKLRLPMERWFSQNPTRLLMNPRARLITFQLVRASRRRGIQLPYPEFAPLADANRIAEWLTQHKGSKVHFDTNVSSAVRIAQVAGARGRSLENTFFRLGGEPLTPSRRELLVQLGARACCHYSMSEIGHIGMACADSAASDEVHFRSDKMALIERPAPPPYEGLNAFYLTSLLASCPKIMLNVAPGDYGESEQRTCNCALGRSGFHLHLHTIRSYEKLTTAGMQFLGTDLIRLLDEVLPAACGGGPSDYQFVEEEQWGGKSIVKLMISPRVGDLDEARCLDLVYRFLRSGAPENRMMADRLRQENAVQLVRREPFSTHASKVLPLHLIR